MKKLISLVLVLCMACMLVSAVGEDSVSGEWYASFNGLVMTLTLSTDSTATMDIAGMGRLWAGTWTQSGNNLVISMTDTDGEESPAEAVLSNGVLAVTSNGETVEFSREPIEAITVADINLEAAPEEFEGDWTFTYFNMEGALIDAATVGNALPGVKIENSRLSFTGESAESLTFFFGTDPLPLSYDSGVMTYTVEIPNDPEPLVAVIQAEMLQDGMLMLVIGIGEDTTIIYETKVAVEEPAT